MDSMANYWNHPNKWGYLESVPSIHINHSGIANQCREMFRDKRPGAGFVAETTTSAGGKIQIRATACHYGGYRFWFVCHGCNKNRLILRYLEQKGRYFCNNCLNGVHATRQCSKSDRGIYIRRKIKKQLGLDSDLLETLGPWDRPKGMHHKTFDKIMRRYNDSLDKDLRAFYAQSSMINHA